MMQLGIAKAELIADDKKIIGFQATYVDGSVVQHTFDSIVIKEAEKQETKEEKKDG